MPRAKGEKVVVSPHGKERTHLEKGETGTTKEGAQLETIVVNKKNTEK